VIFVSRRCSTVVGPSLLAAPAAAPPRTPPFLYRLLKLLPLFGRERLLHALVGLPPNLVNARL
jgi:hypothetical protein